MSDGHFHNSDGGIRVSIKGEETFVGQAPKKNMRGYEGALEIMRKARQSAKELLDGHLLARRDLKPAAALAVATFVFVAVFAWAHMDNAVVVDGEWLWRLWHVGTLIIAVIGVGAVWCVTQGCPWVRGLALCVFTVAVFANTYNDGWFGSYSGTIWHTANSLFIGFTSLTAVALWRWRAALWRSGAIVVFALGYAVRVNGLVFDVPVIWDIMNPLIMLTALACAAAAFQANASPDEPVS